MSRAFAKSFYGGKAWRKCRASYIAYRVSIDGGACQRCKEELGYIVHHKEWITPENINDISIILNHSNLEYVCLNCHNRIEDGEKELGYYIGADGQIYGTPPLN